MTLSANLFVERHALAQLLFWSAFYYLFPAASAAIAADTGWSQPRIALAFTASFLVWSALSPLVGRMVDDGRGATVMTAAGVAGAAVLVVLSFAPTFSVFVIAMLALGAVMAATLYDPCFAIVLRKYGTRAGPEVTKITLIAGFATLVTFGATARLLELGSWRTAFLFFAAAALVATVMLPRDQAASALILAPHRPEAAPALASRKVATIGFGFATVMFSHAALLFTLPIAFQGVHGLALAAALPALLGPSQIAGRLAWSALASRVPLEIAARVLFVVMLAPPLILIGFEPTIGLVLFVVVLQGAGFGIHTVLRPILAAKLLPSDCLGRDLGRIAMIGLVMMAIAPAMAGLVRAWAGLPALLGLLVMMNLCGLAIVWQLHPRAEAIA